MMPLEMPNIYMKVLSNTWKMEMLKKYSTLYRTLINEEMKKRLQNGALNYYKCFFFIVPIIIYMSFHVDQKVVKANTGEMS